MTDISTVMLDVFHQINNQFAALMNKLKDYRDLQTRKPLFKQMRLLVDDSDWLTQIDWKRPPNK